jgi:hypothetical protein
MKEDKTSALSAVAVGLGALFWLICPAASAHSVEHCESLFRASFEASFAGKFSDVLNIGREIEVTCPRFMGRSAATHAIKQQGEAYLMLKEPSQALAQAERCLSASGDAGCLFLKGRALLDLGKRDDGLHFVSLAITEWQGEIGRLRLDPPSDLRDVNIVYLEQRQEFARQLLITR